MIKRFFGSQCLLLAAGMLWGLDSVAEIPSNYAVVVSTKTQADAGWNQVVSALKSNHSAQVLVYRDRVEEVLPALRDQFPRWVCFVVQAEEAGRDLVARVHRLTRQLDDDPYTDCFWGIVTGFDAASALRTAQSCEPLTVHKVASGTEVALEMCEEGQWYDELVKNKHVKKAKGGPIQELRGPDDTTEALVKTLTEFGADLFVTSGHATERDWQIGFRYRNGYFRCENGVLYGLDTQKRRFPIHSANPKVYLPIGNCLMGHVDGRDAMALAWMNSAGVRQMIGYTVPSWYGYAGWGCLDYFVEQPGRYTFTEAYFANNHALIHRLKTYFPGAESATANDDGSLKSAATPSPAATAAGLNADDLRGLLYDRDTVAFFGDPAWVARMAKGKTAWDQTLVEKNGVWTFTITPRRGEKTFVPINRNGSQRGGRPIIAYLPTRIKNVKIISGLELNPEVTDDFILVPNPVVCDPAKSYRVVFQAAAIR
jgi:zinc protease